MTALKIMIVCLGLLIVESAWGVRGAQAFQYNANGSLVYTSTIQEHDASTTMSVRLQDSTRKVVVVSYANLVPVDPVPDIANSVDVPKIVFDLVDIPSNAANRVVRVSVGDFFEDGTNPNGTLWGKFWGGIISPGDSRVTIRLCACVGNGIIDVIDVEEIVRVQSGTEFKAPIRADWGFEGTTRIEAMQIYSGASITIDNGSIFSIIASGTENNPPYPYAIGGDVLVANGSVEEIRGGTANNLSRAGDIRAKIEVPNGSIGLLRSFNGSLVGPASSGTVPEYRVIAGHGISEIAADSINCDIITNFGNPTSAGVGYLRDALVTRAGNFKGRLTSRGFGVPNGAEPVQISIAGDLDGVFDFVESVRSVLGVPAITISGQLASNSLIRIGKSLAGNASNGGVSLPADALDGQIIVNAGNANDSWAADVDVGSANLRTGYSLASAGFGGGAVGLAPFALYLNDCAVPPIGGGASIEINAFNSSANPVYLVQSQMDLDSGIDLAWFGPVVSGSAGVRPLYVYKPHSDGQGGTAYCDATCKTVQTVAPSDIAGSKRFRTVRIRGIDNEFPLGKFLIRNQPLTAQHNACTNGVAVAGLKCDQVVGSPNVQDFNVWIQVLEDCDGNGVVNMDELAGCGGPCPADVDDGTGTGMQDGGMGIEDLLYYLARFELGC